MTDVELEKLRLTQDWLELYLFQGKCRATVENRRDHLEGHNYSPVFVERDDFLFMRGSPRESQFEEIVHVWIQRINRIIADQISKKISAGHC